jgi:regulatory protein
MSFGIDETLQRALDLGYAYLNRRERTVAEVRAQLERKGIAPEHVEDAVRTLEEQGMLGDERFARLFVSDKRELEQWGSERIRRGLLARGIDRALAETALAVGTAGTAGTAAGTGGPGEAGPDAPTDEPTELGRAIELLRRRFPTPPRERRDRDRALGVLLRKGYEPELAVDAVNQHARGD